MWRPSATSNLSTSSPPALPIPVEENVQAAFRRQPPLSPRSTLTEALKANPFRSVNGVDQTRTAAAVAVAPDPVKALNEDLLIFAQVYPDVKIEVLRELLQRFDGESRLLLSTEQLVKHKSEWTKGRLLNPPRDLDCVIPTEELFRNRSYIAASKRVLSLEFKSLNKSVIEAVLAEVNYSYSQARPILQGIAAKTWRVAFSSLFRRKKAVNEAPSFLVEKINLDSTLQRTGNNELDGELDMLFFDGPNRQRRLLQENADMEMAIDMNQQEAEEANALFECQVCYNELPFESITMCTEKAHIICSDCSRRSLNEAIFGQGWAQSVDVEHGTLRCVAPDSEGMCSGHIPPSLLQLIVVTAEAGPETWRKFDQRLATDSIRKSGLPMISCPFCHYAEVSHSPDLSSAQNISWRFRELDLNIALLLSLLLAIIVSPIVMLSVVIAGLISSKSPRHILNTSLLNAYQSAQTRRFRCKNPICARTSCLSCSKSWHDPHTCHEPLIISLRTAVEAARTAALKRTCPRCGTSFIKSSGCNKLVCVCGYAMCYLCRKNIGRVNMNGSVDDRDGGEGYRHFCEHFRPLPGQRCTDCNKCDLYMNENEEVLVKKAGEDAEKEWREREGMVGVKNIGLEQAVGNLGQLRKDDALASAWEKFVHGNWTVQEVCDWGVKTFIIVET